MRNELRLTSRAGFTLIEVLVTLILIALLAAAVFPVITQQIGAADAPKLASDLSSLRSGIDIFNANVRTYPGDLEDLVNKPSSTGVAGDIAIITAASATNYYENKHLVRWDGPYVDLSLQTDDVDNAGGSISNNFGAISTDLTCLDNDVAVPATAACEGGQGHFVSIQLTGLTATEFAKLNDSVDPSEDTGFSPTQQQQQGKLRCVVSGTDCTTTFYLVGPYVAK